MSGLIGLSSIKVSVEDFGKPTLEEGSFENLAKYITTLDKM